ncbi:hypothetical protein BT69DRAFT_1340218 [Atractiella rhizophila]|nr:hypothetical protein BT69DRAFT_1340218 [Atractiella rhizophila]
MSKKETGPSSIRFRPTPLPSFPYHPPQDAETAPRLVRPQQTPLPLRPMASFPPYQEGLAPPTPYSAPAIQPVENPLYYQPYPSTSDGPSRRSSSLSEDHQELTIRGSAARKSPRGEGAHLGRTPRQLAHVASEQKRRENINRGFDDLRQLIPAARGANDPKATILRKASWWIIQLQEENSRLRSHIQSLNAGSPPNAAPQSDVCPSCMRRIDYNQDPPRELLERTYDFQVNNSVPSSPMSAGSATTSGENQALHVPVGRKASASSLTGSLGHRSARSMGSEMEVDELDSENEREILAVSHSEERGVSTFERARPRRIWEEN